MLERVNIEESTIPIERAKLMESTIVRERKEEAKMTSAIQKLIEWQAGDSTYFWSLNSHDNGTIGLTMIANHKKVYWVFTKVEILQARCDVLSMKVDELAVALADYEVGKT